MRRIIIIISAALVLAALPAAALAAPAQRFSDTQTTIYCEVVSTADGTLFLNVGVSESFGTFGAINFWAAPADWETQAPDVVNSTADVTFSADRTSVTGTFDLVEFAPNQEPPFGDGAGTAVLAATLEPMGDPVPINFVDDSTNRKFRVTGTSQPLAVDGTLELMLSSGDVTFELDGCFASTDSITFFSTDPATTIQRGDQIGLFCTWESETGFVSLGAFGFDDGMSFSDIFVMDESGTYVGFGEASLTADAYSADLELFVFSDEHGAEGDPVGSASASATLTPTGERVRFTDRFDGSAFKAMGERLAVDGTLVLETPAGAQQLTMDDTSCSAQDVRTMSRSTNPGGGPKGRPQPNDTPEGAIPLAPGDDVRLITGGTAFEPEAPCLLEGPDEEQFDLFMSHTVWYTIEGTGGPVTIDTAGSDYDTVLGVYTSDEGSLSQVACVDDVFVEPDGFSLQASVTIDTEIGVTYYVQAGGLNEQGGRLRLSVR